MKCYVDSSVVLRFLLNKDMSFKRTKGYKETGSSELLFIECNRVLERYRLENIISDEQLAEVRGNLELILKGFYLIEITKEVKKAAAASFPTIIGTLDAIHLASASLWKDDDELVLFTFDKQMVTCAKAMGFSVLE
jgi:predicted nucleic acid-binding protein